MISRVISGARAAGLERVVVVVGHGRELIIPLVESEGAEWAVQEEQLGTAHAVSCAIDSLGEGPVVVLLGDVPLVESGTIELLEERRTSLGAGLAVLTMKPPDPTGYGRIIRENGLLSCIVEERDATPSQRQVQEVNTGIMSFGGDLLPGLLGMIGSDNDQGEYYLTDAVVAARDTGTRCAAVLADDWREVSGVNDRVQLAEATDCLRLRVLEGHMRAGVTIPDPGSVWIEEGVEIGRDVYVGRGVRLSGGTSVGDGCRIMDGCIVEKADVGPGTVLAPYTVLAGGGDA